MNTNIRVDMQNILSVFTISVFSLVGWAIGLGIFSKLQTLPRLWFVLSHYILDVAIFGALFFVYYKYFGHFSPFATMAIAMITLFVVEFIFWRYFYAGDLWFLNFWDWILPVFIVASTIYLVGVFVK